MKKIAVANQKGGCGKTTTTINLAGALAELGKKTLIVDLDPQAHASFGLGVNNQSMDRSTYNVLTDNTEKARPIHDCIVKVSENLDIVPSNILLSTLEQELKDKEDAVSKLHQALSGSQLDYQYIIIDCPPSLGFLTFNALRAADQILVPIDMSAFSLMGVGKLLGMLELIKIKIHHAPQVNALATLFDRRTKYSQLMYDEISMFFRNQMLATIIRMNVDLKKAAAKGVAVVKFNKDSIGAMDYTALGKEILRADGALEFEQALSEVPAAAETAVVINTPRHTTESGAPIVREVAFNITAPDARDIFVVGDFNHWKINDESRLSRLEDGRWEKKFGMAPGRYKYKFVVDGEWVLDSQNGDREQNSFGTFDSIMNLQG
jgi:chromosome partitioning protein